MKIRRLLAALAGAVALGSAGIARAQTPQELNVVLTPADSTAQVFYAQDMGFFKTAGLDVHITTMQGSPAVASAIASGAADIGSAVVGSGVAARSHGIDVQFLAPAGLYLASNPTAQLMTLPDSPLKTAADFNDKTIAEASLADLPYWATKTWLDQNGGTSARVKFIELPLPEMLAALKDHRVDGAVMFEPFVTAAGTDARAVAPVVSSVGKRFMATGWLANHSWLSAHQDAASRFASAMKQAADWANGHPKESIAILLKYTRLTPELAGKMTRVQYGTTLNVADIQPPLDNALKYGSFPRPVTAVELIWVPAK